jgi:hypothetical protein
MKIQVQLDEQEMTQNDMIDMVKNKLPEAKKLKKLSMGRITFNYKDHDFNVMEKDGQIACIPANVPKMPHMRTELMEVLAEVTKKLRTKRKLKLEDALREYEA